MTQYELVQARKYLQQEVLVLRKVEGISSTTLKVVWEVCKIYFWFIMFYLPFNKVVFYLSLFQVITDYNEYLEGVKIWFNGSSINHQLFLESFNSSDDSTNFTKHQTFSMITVHNSGSSSHLVTGLLPYANYDVFLMPFYKLLLGKPSNLRTATTDDDCKFSIFFISSMIMVLSSWFSYLCVFLQYQAHHLKVSQQEL